MNVFPFSFENVDHIAIGGPKGGGLAVAFVMAGNTQQLTVTGAAAMPMLTAWLAFVSA